MESRVTAICQTQTRMITASLFALGLANLGKDPFVVTLPSGTTARIVAVSNGGGRYWAPDGSEVGPSDLEDLRRRVPEPNLPDATAAVIYFEVRQARVDYTVDYVGNLVGDHDASLAAMSFSTSDVRPGVWFGYCYIAPHVPGEIGLNVGVAESPFEPVATAIRQGKGFKTTLGPELKVSVQQIKPDVQMINGKKRVTPQFSFQCRVPKVDSENFQERFTVFEKKGQRFGNGGVGRSGELMSGKFDGLAENVGSFRFEIRPYLWARFRGIRLRPGSGR